MFANLKCYPKAREHFQKALKIVLKIRDKAGEELCYANLGHVFADLHDHSKAINLYQKALKIAIEIDDKDARRIICQNIGSCTLY